MAFKQDPNKRARLEDLSKAVLIKTVRTLQRRETKLLNQVAKLEGAALDSALEANGELIPGVQRTLFPWEAK